jgi:glycosyltransferase involved in cell wall biosynthesis
MTPALSIVICTRNRARQLQGTLDSLAGLQGDTAWEAILVDNNSTDDTAAVIHTAAARDRRIRYVLGEKIGLGAARNAGWREARAAVVSFTDDDCYVASDYADAMVQAFAEHTEAGFVGGRVLLHDPEDLAITIDTREAPERIAPYRFAAAGSVQGANFAFRREVLERIGGFDDGLGAGTPFPCEDIDAVSAALFEGIEGRFDPRPVIRHHHGRREADLPKLMAGYDNGRGAYYAKYLMRRDSRAAFARAWLAEIRGDLGPHSRGRLRREIGSALRFVQGRHGKITAAGALLPLAGLYGFVSVARLAQKLTGR